MKPMLSNIGYGFTMTEPDSALVDYKYEQVGRYHNYHFTTKNYHWPVNVRLPNLIIDGFSPNLNKKLHVGHLRNFCVANAIHHITESKMVAMLGAAVGENPDALNDLKTLCDTHDYCVSFFKDTELDEPDLELEEGEGEKKGTKVWGDQIVMIKSDGSPSYAYYDMAFAQQVGPDYYITGAEQADHFKSLGLGKKHLPMGLVLGTDGKKIKSRNGDALLLTESLELIADSLKETKCDKHKLAWNIACCNMLMASRNTNVKFDVNAWVNPTASPGMYLSYTYARLYSALNQAQVVLSAQPVTEPLLPLMAQCSYLNYYLQMSIDKLDPAPVAQYAFDLAQCITKYYHIHNIKNGNASCVFVFQEALETLQYVMEILGMKPLTEI